MLHAVGRRQTLFVRIRSLLHQILFNKKYSSFHFHRRLTNPLGWIYACLGGLHPIYGTYGLDICAININTIFTCVYDISLWSGIPVVRPEEEDEN